MDRQAAPKRWHMSCIWRLRTSITRAPEPAARSPQPNGICERFHKAVLNEFYRVAFHIKVYRSLGELQADLDARVKECNETRSHQGRWCFGKTPMQTFPDALPLTNEKMIAA